MSLRLKLPSPGRVYLPKAHMPRISSKLRYRFVNKGHRIGDYMQKWNRVFLLRCGGAIRAYVINRIKSNENKKIHSPIGQSPYAHLKKSEFLRPAIQFAISLPSAGWLAGGTIGKVLVGTSRRKAGYWGRKHEYGGWINRGEENSKGFFPPRPFMRPGFARWIKFGLPTIMKDMKTRAIEP